MSDGYGKRKPKYQAWKKVRIFWEKCTFGQSFKRNGGVSFTKPEWKKTISSIGNNTPRGENIHRKSGRIGVKQLNHSKFLKCISDVRAVVLQRCLTNRPACPHCKGGVRGRNVPGGKRCEEANRLLLVKVMKDDEVVTQVERLLPWERSCYIRRV